jgi:iron only hydrogenase large subunit-like protein
MQLQSIYTEKNNCQDCYKCVRRCPVKAIKIEDHSASIISDLCIHCGYCTFICPSGAKKIRNDVSKVQELINANKKVIATIAPSWVSEFPNYTSSSFINALKKLGFSEISEVAIGAEMVSKKTNEYLQNTTPGLHISSCCPSVVSFIQKYYPQHISKIIPLDSPMIAHAKYLRELMEEEIKLVFIGPCIAKKNEAEDYPGNIDFALSFAELKSWLNEEGIEGKSPLESKNEFFPFKATDGSVYPVDGGMINSMKKQTTTVDLDYMSFSGRNIVKDVLNNLDDLEQDSPCFLELLTCKGGCINGPGCSNQNAIIKKRAAIIKDFNQTQNIKKSEISNIEIDHKYSATEITPKIHDENDIIDALNSIGKSSEKDELNCSGCGYESCKDFVCALLDGKAERDMCVSYMRKLAQNKASMLLQKMPYGVVICDEKLRIIESNQQFARLLGTETAQLFQDIPGLESASLKQIFPSYKLFQNLINTGLDYYEKDIAILNKPYHISLFSIQKHKIACGILRNLQQPEVRNEEVIKRAKEVIYENLSTVQKVASLLGENAAKTESMLNSIVQSYQMTEDD